MIQPGQSNGSSGPALFDAGDSLVVDMVAFSYSRRRALAMPCSGGQVPQNPLGF